MKTVIVVTYDKHSRGIGTVDGVPWVDVHDTPGGFPPTDILPANTALVMGSTTYRQMGEPIEGHVNIVISRSSIPGVVSCHSVTDALTICGMIPNIEQVMFMGGEHVYKEALEMGVDEIYATVVDYGDHEYTTFFPPIGPSYELSFTNILPDKSYRIFTNI